MSEERRARRIDRLFRLALILLALIWVLLPPHPATPEIVAAAPVLDRAR